MREGEDRTATGEIRQKEEPQEEREVDGSEDKQTEGEELGDVKKNLNGNNIGGAGEDKKESPGSLDSQTNLPKKVLLLIISIIEL